MFSFRYLQEEDDLCEYFSRVCVEEVRLTKEDLNRGTDSLVGNYRKIIDSAFTKWLTERNYELSYSQICRAFFSALDTKGLLKLI